jgi:iron complex outermembrane receptor protein
MRTRSALSLVSQTAIAVLVVAGLLGTAPHHAHAQDTGTVEGLVQTADGEPARGVNVSLKSTSLGSTTNDQGRYTISSVSPGSYTLVVSYVGLETQKREIEVRSGERVTVSPITLQASTQRLEEVVVAAGGRASYATETSEYVAKMPLKKIDNPQVYNSIPETLLDDQVTTSFDDVMTNAPGVFKLWASTGRGGDGSGYYSIRGFAVQPTMRNGRPALTNGSPDPANVERVEIPKGPSGTLYGSSLISYGGLINVVTKKPYSSFGGEVAYKTGSFGLNRATADVNAPVGEDDDLAIRVTGAFDSRESFQDAGFSQSAFVAPSLSYEASEKLSFFVNAEYYTAEKTNPTMLFMARSTEPYASTLDELNYDPDHSFTSNDLTVSTPTLSLQGQMQYDLSDAWTSTTSVSRSRSRSKGNYTYLYENSGQSGSFFRFVSDQNSTTLNTDLQQNLVGTFDLSITEHQMVVGGGYRHERLVNNGTGFVLFDQVSLGTSSPSGISQVAVDTALAKNGAANHSATEQATYSAYASDVVRIVPQVSVMASLRLDHFDQDGTVSSDEDDYTQTTLSPKFGVVVRPLPDRLSLFGNYMNGFSNVAPRTEADGTTKSFEPERANQWEAGIKANAFDKRLTATVSYYDIAVSNTVLETEPDVFVQNGEQESRGVEVSVTAAPAEGLNVIAGYSYNESEITEGEATFEGYRPEEAGPQNLFNAWASYRVPDGVLEGFGVGLGANYASENKILNRDTGQFTLPSYTVFDASISYETSRYRLDLKVNNLTDETYYKGWTTINPQAPRSVKANVAYKF